MAWRVSPTSFRPEREWFRPEVEVTYQKEIFPSCKKIHLSIEFEEKKVYAQNEGCSVMPWKRDLSWEHVETNKLSPRAERKEMFKNVYRKSMFALSVSVSSYI